MTPPPRPGLDIGVMLPISAALSDGTYPIALAAQYAEQLGIHLRLAR